MAAIALLRLHHYTDEASYRDKAEETLETFAGIADQFGIFAATYGIAVLHYLESPVQVVVISDERDLETADELYAAAVAPFAFGKATLKISASHVVAGNLPPSLAATIPNLPQLGKGKSFAVLCSGMTCQPPIWEPDALRQQLESRANRAA